VIRVLLATPDAELTGRSQTLVREAGDIEVAATAASATEVMDELGGDVEFDVIILHEDLGPLPVLDLARDLNHRFPHVGVVLLSGDPSIELLRAAMSAGVRSVTRLPLSFAELSSALVDANEWAQAVRGRLTEFSEQHHSDRLRGRVIGIAGSKGGVGTTTLAVQLALELQRRDPDRRVCLVDLDLQTGDVRSYLDVAHRRSVTDLLDVATELTTGHLADAMYTHPTGLRVLLPPVNGEDGEDLDGQTMARILGGIRSRFDTVIVDLGAVGSEASATAIELTDEVLLVCTPDVVSLRGANRAVSLWRRLHLREGGIRVVLNRVSKDREVQPSLAARVVELPFTRTVVPDRTSDLEHAVNTGVPERLQGQVRDAVERLAKELADGMPSAEPADLGAVDREEDLARRVTADESGGVQAEFAALILPIAFVVLAVWQFILAGYTVVLANRAADDGARELAIEGRDQQAIEAAAAANLHGHWRRELSVATVAEDGDEVEVTIPVPLLMPGLNSPWQITTSTGAVLESNGAPDGRGPTPEVWT
jgi:pilus assembly protein CpaE